MSLAPTRGLRALWKSRPPSRSAILWALMIWLDYLPWPVGEDVVAGLFAAAAFIKPSRRRLAIAWASKHSRHRAWRLAAAACAFRGRWVARSALVGVRGPDDLRKRIVLRGEERLTPASTGTILLGFHLGPPGVDVALRILGHRMAWLGGARSPSRAWWRDAWLPLLDPKDNLTPPRTALFWPGYLYRARRILLDGGTVFMMADDWPWRGQAALTVPVTGGALHIMPGWLGLWRQTNARVLPVLTHLEGRTHVIVIHPPLSPDGATGPAWPDTVTELVKRHVDQFPVQSPNLLFPARPGTD